MERENIITFMGKPLTLMGTEMKTGLKAPDFRLMANDLSTRTLADYYGKAIILSIVPSLDTSLCDAQTRRFNQEAGSLFPAFQVLTISCDLPFAQARWCGISQVSNLHTLSDYYDNNFGLAYGVLIKELRLLTRSIFILNYDHIITYIQIVPEVASEVDYVTALEAAWGLL
jgi:thiol peroxidase